MTDKVEWMAIATVVAIVLSPIIAVQVTRYFDDRKETLARRMSIFRTLMRTRRMRIHVDHVGALNLIEIEFANESKVIAAWKAYLENLALLVPEESESDAQHAFTQTRGKLLTKLIYQISLVLKLKVEQLDILEGNYIPQGWFDENEEQRIARGALLAVLNGHRAIAIRPFSPTTNSEVYPPAPNSPSSIE